MEHPFSPSDSIYLDQNYNEIESAYANGRIYYNLRYSLTWACDGSNTLNWKPDDTNYRLISNNLDLNNPGTKTSVYLKKDQTALIKVYGNPQGILNLQAVFNNDTEREQLIKLVAPQIELLSEDNIKPNVNFWYTHPSYGPRAMTKPIEVPLDDKIMFNYASSIRPQLLDLVNLPAEKAIGGKLILLHGVPGTGKTYFIRHLMHKWRSWCNFQYISDPENFFQNPAYLFEVTKFFDMGALPNEIDPHIEFASSVDQKSTLVVLEDAGEFIEAESNTEFVAKSLNKLLNITDGLLGQGLKLLILITTNQETKTLDPAILRSGRCLSNIGFEALPESDVLEWHNYNSVGSAPLSGAKLLSDLYNQK